MRPCNAACGICPKHDFTGPEHTTLGHPVAVANDYRQPAAKRDAEHQHPFIAFVFVRVVLGLSAELRWQHL